MKKSGHLNFRSHFEVNQKRSFKSTSHKSNKSQIMKLKMQIWVTSPRYN